MRWLIAILLVGLAQGLMGCEKGEVTTGTTITGTTTYITAPETPEAPKFNWLSLLSNPTGVEQSTRDNSQVMHETVYADGRIVLSIQHTQSGLFSRATEQRFADTGFFFDFLAKRNLAHLAGSVRRIEQTDVTGFAADDGRCAAAAFTKKLNADSGYDNDPGLPDTTVQLAMCGGLALSLDEFIGRFGFATTADIAAYRPEKMRVNRPRGAVASMPNPETRPMTVSWQGFEALITGTAEISVKGLHDAKLHLPDGKTACDGNFQGRRWTIVCDNGLTANGLYRLEDGAAGDGYDNRGRQVSFEVRG